MKKSNKFLAMFSILSVILLFSSIFTTDVQAAWHHKVVQGNTMTLEIYSNSLFGTWESEYEDVVSILDSGYQVAYHRDGKYHHYAVLKGLTAGQSIVTFDNRDSEAWSLIKVSGSGWRKEGIDWLYYDDYFSVRDWNKIDGHWYYMLPEDGVMQTSWTQVGSTWYYMNSSGHMQTGWQKINSNWYYMNNSGAMQTGWNKLNNNWYYMNSSGAMQTGWIQVNGSWYYMNSSGVMQTGWQKVNSNWYYMNSSGLMQTGWNKLNNNWYYMNSSGAMQTGWTQVNGTRYYMNNSGHMQTGWNKLNNNWFYLNSSGAMQQGWTQVNGTWYYMNSSGSMQTGWTQVSGTWYYMNSSGGMQTGWLKLGSSWYYLNNNGSMQTESKEINNKWYHFDSSGRMTDEDHELLGVYVELFKNSEGNNSIYVQYMIDFKDCDGVEKDLRSDLFVNGRKVNSRGDGGEFCGIWSFPYLQRDVVFVDEKIYIEINISGYENYKVEFEELGYKLINAKNSEDMIRSSQEGREIYDETGLNIPIHN